MRRRLRAEDLGDLLDRPLGAVLATRREDGSLLLSPVWHEWHDGGFTVATSSDDVKVAHLRRDPQASVLVYEHEPPYRGIEVRGDAEIGHDAGGETGRRLAIRYLGEEEGARFADRWQDDTLIRVEPGRLRAWDFADDYGAT
jgi:PPOX class probable F420-dependent enzyme